MQSIMDSREGYETSSPLPTSSVESFLVAQALVDLRAASCHDEPAPATEAQHVSPRGSSLQNTKGTTSHRPSSDIPKKKETTPCKNHNKQSKKVNTGRWSKEEHAAFMEGMIEFHGDTRKWIQVSRMVQTRSGDQCKTHAQKYLISLDRQHSVSKYIQTLPADLLSATLECQDMSACSKSTTPLPLDFELTPFTVIVGRGRLPKQNSGNKHLRSCAKSCLDEYSNATDKRTKSMVVSTVFSMMRDANPAAAAFVKRGKNGRWFEVNDSVAREKIGYTFRDLLCDRYRSSSKSKVARKKDRGKVLTLLK